MLPAQSIKLEKNKVYDYFENGKDLTITFKVLSGVKKDKDADYYILIKLMDNSHWWDEIFYVTKEGKSLNTNKVIENIIYNKTKEFELDLKDLIDE